jgi:hypothetical protein
VADGDNSSPVKGKNSSVNKRTTRHAKKDPIVEHPISKFKKGSGPPTKTNKSRPTKKEPGMQEQKEKEKAEMRRREHEEKRQKIRMWDEQFEAEKLREEMGEKEYRRLFYSERRKAVSVFMQTIETKTVKKNVKKTA